ncbi:MAG TPA: hypothetical protein DDW52_12325 [Planctomycetaceae bacterium]|nr:hypothetical protein [Planctomycetaceae bacterium]
MVLIKISCRLLTTEEKLWEKLGKPESLQFIASPVLKFVPQDGQDLGARWRIDHVYQLKLYLFGFIPLGRHDIQLVNIDRNTNTILSKESGSLTRVWNHRIHFYEEAKGVVSYADQIEIEAGLLTPLIWVFAQLFYRYRQRRWSSLLRQPDTATPSDSETIL